MWRDLMADRLKVAYLFGAGATHAELFSQEKKGLTSHFDENRALLLSKVSSRVMSKATRDRKYRKGIEMVSNVAGPPNIELLISLIESSRIQGYDKKTKILKDLVRRDIESRLTAQKRKSFYLHRALLEMHDLIGASEQVVGLISLNYDTVLDEAYRKRYGFPNYAFTQSSLGRDPKPLLLKDPKPLLLKLHGSFNWRKIKIRGRPRNIDIIPLGANKSYLHVPYNNIWANALEVISNCSVLRVIGCSLSQNDTHLIDLLFKAHLEKGTSFEIQLICSDEEGERIKRNLGFFKGIKKITEIESALIPDDANARDSNPFRIWLQYKGQAVLGEGIKETEFLKKTI